MNNYEGKRQKAKRIETTDFTDLWFVTVHHFSVAAILFRPFRAIK